MPLSDTLANALLNHTFVNTAFPAPTAWWVQLHYGDPGSSGTSNVWSAAGRRQVTDWTNSTLGTLSNNVDVEFTELPDPGVHPTISWVSIHSLAVAGDHYGNSQLTTPRTVAEGDSLSLETGAIDITVV